MSTKDTNIPKLSLEESADLALGIASQVALEFKDQLTADDDNGPVLDQELVQAMFRRAMNLAETAVTSLNEDPN